MFYSRVLTHNINKNGVFKAKSAQKNLSITGKIILKNEDKISKLRLSRKIIITKRNKKHIKI